MYAWEVGQVVVVWQGGWNPEVRRYAKITRVGKTSFVLDNGERYLTRNGNPYGREHSMEHVRVLDEKERSTIAEIQKDAALNHYRYLLSKATDHKCREISEEDLLKIAKILKFEPKQFKTPPE